MVETARIEAEAIAWHLRLADMAGSEWESFVAWLERAPEHRAAYDRVADADAFLAEAGPLLDDAAAAHESVPAEPVVPRRHWRPALAAAVTGLALVGTLAFWPGRGGEQIERTRPGTTKEIAFSDGTRIDLNGGTAMALDPADQRSIRLDAGEALFRVRHGGKPFTVDAGGFRIRDLGTVFNVELTERSLKIDVSEGQVQFDPDGAALTLGPGDGLTVDRQRNLVVRRGSPGAGGWRTGELAFTDARLDDVVEALNRRYGSRIELSGGLSGQPFTGNIRSLGDEAGDVAHLARLIGADFRRDGDMWVLSRAVRVR